MIAIEYPWYQVVEGTEQLLQGDLVTDCPVLVPEAPISTKERTPQPLPARVLKYNVVVLTQSCDLIENKVDLVLVSPYWPLTEFSNRDEFLKGKKGKEQLRRGNLPGYHLLNRSEIAGFETDLLVVQLPSGPQPLLQICKALLVAEINIDYAYPLLVGADGRAALALHIDMHEAAVQTLTAKGFVVLTENDLSIEL